MADNKYGGMTVNERLYVSGWMGEFDQAVAARDVSRVIMILRDVELTDGNIDPILKNKRLPAINQIGLDKP